MSRLEKTTHGFLIVVCCASLFLLSQQYLAHRLQGSAVPANASPTGTLRRVEVGDVLPLTGVNWAGTPTNVVLGLRSECKYCEDSIPLYREISKLRQRRDSSIALYAASTDSPSAMKEFLSRAGVTVDRILQVKFESLGIPGTPAVLLVDARGTVKQKFVGELNAERTQTLLSALSPAEAQEGR